MRNKKMFGFLVLAVVVGVGILGWHSVAQAASTTYSFFTTTNILGIPVLTGSSGAINSKFVIVDMTGVEEEASYDLPALSSVSTGTIYMIKVTGMGNPLTVYPNGTDTIDGTSDHFTYPVNMGAMWVADTSAGTWWQMFP